MSYDAWNRLMTVSDGTTLVAAYVYDGLKRRIVKKSYSGGTLTETRDFYFSDRWQVLGERASQTVPTPRPASRISKPPLPPRQPRFWPSSAPGWPG